MMIIDRVRIFPFDIPLRDVFTIATMSLSTAQNLLVEIRTNQDVIGWGEASSFRSIVGETQRINIAAAQELKPLLVGKNPLAARSIMDELEAYLPHNTTLKSAIDMALFDVASQACGLPLCAYLGGERRELQTDLTIGIDEASRAVEKALAAREMGFRIIKVKVGLNPKDDYERLAAIRRAVGSDTVLRIDANQGWDRITAVRCLEAFAEVNIEFCEQPCRADDHQGMRYVHHHAPIPVMADESIFSAAEALDMICQDSAAYFNIKLSKSGGIHHAQKIAEVALAGYRPCMMGCMSESRLGITAAAHLACASPIIRFFDLDSCLEHSENRIVGGVEYKGGTISLPDGPGIGARPEPDFVRSLQEIT
ncbi:MAG TPA: dipeptide epimerase [Spirochaetia bacterium]|nr:dipeptide epimerase [Spirochaetia bacterium]